MPNAAITCYPSRSDKSVVSKFRVSAARGCVWASSLEFKYRAWCLGDTLRM